MFQLEISTLFKAISFSYHLLPHPKLSLLDDGKHNIEREKFMMHHYH